MERDTYLYKLRRKCQCVATKVFGYSAMTKFYYRILLHEKCNLKNPCRFRQGHYMGNIQSI